MWLDWSVIWSTWAFLLLPQVKTHTWGFSLSPFLSKTNQNLAVGWGLKNRDFAVALSLCGTQINIMYSQNDTLFKWMASTKLRVVVSWKKIRNTKVLSWRRHVRRKKQLKACAAPGNVISQWSEFLALLFPVFGLIRPGCACINPDYNPAK